MDRSFYVVVYDVVEDKRRLKVAKYLESMGDRVQYSVFEVYLTPKELQEVMKKLATLIEAEEDGIRVYNLCTACREKVHSLGQGVITPPPGLIIV